MGVEGGERLTQLPGFASPFPMGVTLPASHIASENGGGAPLTGPTDRIEDSSRVRR